MRITRDQSYRFGDYQLIAAERVLKRSGEIVPMPLKPFEVLLILIEQHGQVVSKDELMRRVWPDSFVEEANLARHIYLLRQILGESSKGNGSNAEKGEKHRYIQTVPGRGYLFAAEVENGQSTIESEEAAEAPEKAAGAEDQRYAPAEVQPQPRRTWRQPGSRPVIVSLAIAILISLLVILTTFRASVHQPSPEMTIKRLTSNINILFGSISPDGQYIVNTVVENGQRSIWVRLVASGSEKQIVPPTLSELGGITFSPDGNFVYYTSTSKAVRDAALYQVPIIGGPTRKIKEGLNSPASFAPDGVRFAFVREDSARCRSSLLIG